MLVEQKEELLRFNPFHPSLKTHKLHGSFSNLYAISVNYQYRIVFRFINKNIVYFYDIGTHDLYD